MPGRFSVISQVGRSGSWRCAGCWCPADCWWREHQGRGTWPLGLAGARGEPWDEDATGILIENSGVGFDDNLGPAVWVSEWWLRAHWGRVLEIARYEPSEFALPHARQLG